MIIMSATALVTPGLAIKLPKASKLLNFKLSRTRPARFMVEDLGYFPSLSGHMKLYHSGCPVVLKIYAAFILATGGY